MKYIDWRSVLLNPTQMCINAIELMYYLTQYPLDSFIDASVIMSGPRFTTEVMIDISPGPGRLLLPYAVQALYQLSVRMAQESRYFLQWGKIFVNGKQCGIIRFQQISNGSPINDLIAGSDLLGSRDSSNNGTREIYAFPDVVPTRGNYSANADDEGKIFDPKDKRLVIEFKFDNSKMRGREVFTSFLDGLAIATEHDQAEVGASVDTYSASLETSLYIHHLDSPRYYRRGLTWGVMARVLIMIWEQLIMGNSPGRRGRLPRYEGLDFDIYNDDVIIGVGRLWSVGMPGVGVSVSR